MSGSSASADLLNSFDFVGRAIKAAFADTSPGSLTDNQRAMVGAAEALDDVIPAWQHLKETSPDALQKLSRTIAPTLSRLEKAIGMKLVD